MAQNAALEAFSTANDPTTTIWLYNSIEQLIQTLAEEIDALRTNRYDSLAEYSRRKSRSLLELSRSARHISAEQLNDQQKGQLILLRERLQENQDLLFSHLNAAREITQLAAQALEEAESDGTYAGPLSRDTKK